MYCRKCGKQLSDGAKFCTYCGTQRTPRAQPQADVSQKKKMNPLQVILAIAAAAILVVYAVTGLSIPEMISEMGYATSFAECNLIVLSRSNKVECAILKKRKPRKTFLPFSVILSPCIYPLSDNNTLLKILPYQSVGNPRRAVFPG